MAMTALKTNDNRLRYYQQAKTSGMPADQLRRFLAAGYVAQPVAMEFHAACRECDNEDGPVIVGFGGARGGGKSHSSLAQIGLDDCQRFDGLKVLFLRNVGKAARESFEDLVPRIFKHVAHNYVGTKGKLYFPNGSLIVLGHFKNENDIDAYLGIEYDIICIEEATLLSKSKRQRLEGSLRSSKAGWRPRIYLTTNPGGIGHGWFKEEIIDPWRRGIQTKTRFIKSLAVDNKFINKTYHEYLASLTGWLGRAWRDGDWDIASGQYFITFSYDHHVVKNLTPQPHWEYWLAMDYGYVHWNTIYLMAKDGDGNVMALDELAHRREMPEAIAPDIADMLKRNGLQKGQIQKFVAGGDVFSERGGEKTVAQKYKEFGYNITRANMSRISGAMEISTRLANPAEGKKPTLFISDKCAKLAHILPMMLHDPNRPEDVLKVDIDDDGDGGDDPYDGFRYGVMVAQRPITPQQQGRSYSLMKG